MAENKCIMVNFGRQNDDVFETCVKSFRSVCPDTYLRVYSDIKPKDGWVEKYSLDWRVMDIDITGQMEYVRYCYVIDMLKEGDDNIIMVDQDFYFLKDPFDAFDEYEFDLGVTTRCHTYMHHNNVNGGIWYLRGTQKAKDLVTKLWPEYCDYHTHNRNWFVGQCFLTMLYEEGYAVDVGWYWNYCPSAGYYGYDVAVDMLKRAYETKSVCCLHLKDITKYCIYDGFLEHAVIDNWKGFDHGLLATGNFR